MRALAGLLIVTMAGTAAQPDTDAIGVSGGVGNHEGSPIAEGTVTLQSLDRSSIVSTSLDRSGRFQVVPTVTGRHRMTIVVPGYAPRLADVIVPSSRTIALPMLLLEAPTYFRARFVTTDGEVIVSPVVRSRNVGVDGATVPVSDGFVRIDADGTVAIGPLPSGITGLAVDMPGLAQTRLPDVRRGEHGPSDVTTIVILPGSVAQVAIVNSDGTPIADHPVTMEDAQPNSPLAARTVRTDPQGRATFDRLGAGRYRISTSMLEPCNRSGIPLSVAQMVEVSGTGNVGARIVVGGQAALRVTSQGASLSGAAVSVSPNEAIAPRRIAIPGKPPIVLAPPSCAGSTDGDGRAMFSHVPPGSARVSVRLHNSILERRVELRGDGREIAVRVPDGAIQLRAIDASTGRPVPRASVTWDGGGYRVLATATGNGDVLLEGVGDAPGLVSVSAPGYVEAKAEVPASPAPLDVALTPAPSSVRSVRVIADTGEVIAQAILLLAPATIFDVGVYAVTDRNGEVRFSNVPPGVARVVAQADGFVGAALNLPADSDRMATLTLARRK